MILPISFFVTLFFLDEANLSWIRFASSKKDCVKKKEIASRKFMFKECFNGLF